MAVASQTPERPEPETQHRVSGPAQLGSSAAEALEPDFSATHRAPNRTQNPQNHSDEHKNAADCVQNWNTGEVADQQQNDTQDDHGAPLLLNAV